MDTQRRGYAEETAKFIFYLRAIVVYMPTHDESHFPIGDTFHGRRWYFPYAMSDEIWSA